MEVCSNSELASSSFSRSATKRSAARGRAGSNRWFDVACLARLGERELAGPMGPRDEAGRDMHRGKSSNAKLPTPSTMDLTCKTPTWVSQTPKDLRCCGVHPKQLGSVVPLSDDLVTPGFETADGSGRGQDLLGPEQREDGRWCPTILFLDRTPRTHPATQQPGCVKKPRLKP